MAQVAGVSGMLRQTPAYACEARTTGSKANCPTTDCKTGAIPATICEATKMIDFIEMRERLFQMLYQYMNENYPNVLSEMIQCAKEESSK
jgi:hypothetical protein